MRQERRAGVEEAIGWVEVPDREGSFHKVLSRQGGWGLGERFLFSTVPRIGQMEAPGIEGSFHDV